MHVWKMEGCGFGVSDDSLRNFKHMHKTVGVLTMFLGGTVERESEVFGTRALLKHINQAKGIFTVYLGGLKIERRKCEGY